MNILTNVHRAGSGGGVEMSVLQTTQELVKRGHRFHLIYGEEGDLVPEFRSLCASVHHVRYCDYFFPDDRRQALKERLHVIPAVLLAAKSRPDVYLMNRSYAAAWALDAARLSPAPVVCQWHGPNSPSPRHVAHLSSKVTRFTAISEFVRDAWLKAGINPDKVDIVYPGIDPSEYPQGGEVERSRARQALDIPQDAFVVAFVGRIDKEKGVDVLLDAWRRLGLGPNEGQLLLMGAPLLHDDPKAYMQSMKSLAQEGTVRFMGVRRDVVTPLHAADVAVVPSLWEEPFGRVVIEALATGRPVVGSRVGAIPEILGGPLRQFLFDRGDASALATVLSGLIDWRTSQPSLGDLCTARVREDFTLESMVRGIETVIEKAVGGK